MPNAPVIALTPEADGSITVQIQGNEPPQINSLKIERCDGGALPDGTCPTGWKQVADVPATQPEPAPVSTATVALASFALIGLAAGGYYLYQKNSGAA